MQNSLLTTKLRSALGFESLAFVYAFLLAGSLGTQSVYTPYTFTTLAGAAIYGSADGTGSAAQFWQPYGVATESSGNGYVGGSGNNTRHQTPTAGDVIALAGGAGSDGSAAGTGSAARFNHYDGVAASSSGNDYVADSENTIRKLTPAGVVTTLAGMAGIPGSADGTGSAARFSDPDGVAVDSAGNIFVADGANYTIRKVTPAGWVPTLAGNAGHSGAAHGPRQA